MWALPPVLVVFSPAAFGFRFRHRVRFQRSAGPRREDLGAGRCAGRKCHVLLRWQSCGVLGE